MGLYTIFVQLGETVEAPEVWQEMLQSAVSATLHYAHHSTPVVLTLLLTDNQEICQLNRDFRGIDNPTDVLSFPAAVMPGKTAYLGDIAISLPYATRQAAIAGHPVTAELQLLAVHGVLHLLGYDHAEAAEKEEMWAAQTAVLTQLGLPHIHPTEQ